MNNVISFVRKSQKVEQLKKEKKDYALVGDLF